METCTDPDCPRPIEAPGVGLCKKHYEEQRRASIGPCHRCGRPSIVDGPPRCSACYKRDREADAAARGDICKVIGCHRPVAIRSARLCDRCYQRWRRAHSAGSTSKTFTGLGVLACRCGRPYTEHASPPCPQVIQT